MSAEIVGKNPDNTALVASVAQNVAEILKATGSSAGEAHTTGEIAASYAAELLLSAIEVSGEVQPGGLADAGFIQTINEITQATINPTLLERDTV